MGRLEMMVAMQMHGYTMKTGASPREGEIDVMVESAMTACKKILAKAAEVNKLERDAENARAGRPR